MRRFIYRVRPYLRGALKGAVAVLILASFYAAYRNAERCDAGGGCITMTRQQYIESLRDAVNAGWEAAKEVRSSTNGS